MRGNSSSTTLFIALFNTTKISVTPFHAFTEVVV